MFINQSILEGDFTPLSCALATAEPGLCKPGCLCVQCIKSPKPRPTIRSQRNLQLCKHTTSGILADRIRTMYRERSDGSDCSGSSSGSSSGSYITDHGRATHTSFCNGGGSSNARNDDSNSVKRLDVEAPGMMSLMSRNKTESTIESYTTLKPKDAGSGFDSALASTAELSCLDETLSSTKTSSLREIGFKAKFKAIFKSQRSRSTTAKSGGIGNKMDTFKVSWPMTPINHQLRNDYSLREDANRCLPNSTSGLSSFSSTQNSLFHSYTGLQSYPSQSESIDGHKQHHRTRRVNGMWTSVGADGWVKVPGGDYI